MQRLIKDNSAITLLFGMEIVTLLSDRLIDKIVTTCSTLHTVTLDDVLALGLAYKEQATAIMEIIKSVIML